MAYKKGEKLKTAFATYAIDEFLGAGGAGEVYAVRDSTNAVFAAKILDTHKATSARLAHFKDALNFCARSTHLNVAPLHDTGVAKKGASFYVTPLYAGSLRRHIAEGIPPAHVLPLFGQILDGVEASHLNHLAHGALKPENIFVTPDRRIVVADFGMATFEEDALHAESFDETGTGPARFPYAAPEQKLNGAAIDPRADIFALGLLLNEMFTGVVPHGKEIVTMNSIASFAPEFAYLDDLVARMIRPDRTQRPASIDEVKKLLIAWGNEFISRQRLNTLKDEVMRETEAGDAFLSNPIKIVSGDYADGTVYLKLNASPTPNWITAFRSPRAPANAYNGIQPDAFVFSGDSMNARLAPEQSALQLVQYAKSYIDLANWQYREDVLAFHQRQMQLERDNLRKQVLDEERRLRILAEIRSAIE